MISVFMVSFIILIIAFVIIGMASLLSKKSVLDREKSSPFECGFDPFSNSRIPFSLRFYMIAIIFLIFDVEIAILLPMPIITSFMPLTPWFMISLIFISTLLIGLFHEWNFGALEWAK